MEYVGDGRYSIAVDVGPEEDGVDAVSVFSMANSGRNRLMSAEMVKFSLSEVHSRAVIQG